MCPQSSVQHKIIGSFRTTVWGADSRRLACVQGPVGSSQVCKKRPTGPHSGCSRPMRLTASAVQVDAELVIRGCFTLSPGGLTALYGPCSSWPCRRVGVPTHTLVPDTSAPHPPQALTPVLTHTWDVPCFYVLYY